MAQKIAVFDYQVTSNNPIGGCHRRLLEGLCHEYEFTVFSVEFDNPCPERIRWVRIFAPTRPLVLLFVVFHLVAPMVYLAHRLRTRTRFDLVQAVESNLGFGDFAYTHFCHRAFLRHHWTRSRPKGLRGMLRWLDHYLHAMVEPMAFRRTRAIVVPSSGLGRELAEEYPAVAQKITVLPNPVDLDHLRRPADFGRDAVRHDLGIGPGDVALVFMALGHFERKGLPTLLDALTRVEASGAKLIVVGGTDDLNRQYRTRVRQLGLEDRVRLIGMCADVRPYLWAADGFVLPSAYETFSLAAFEAAAAGLPIVVTPLNGVEELLRDGENGILIERSVRGVANGLSRILSLSSEDRRAMGEQARTDVQRFATDNFVSAWRVFYRDHWTRHVVA